MYTRKHELISVILILFFLITLDFNSNNLSAATTGSIQSPQETTLAQQFDHTLLRAQKLKDQGDYVEALNALRKANNLANDLGSAVALISVHIKMSDICLTIGQIDQSRKLSEQAMKIAETLKNQPKLMASILNSRGIILTIDKKYEDAIDVFERGLKQAEESAEPQLAVRILVNLANAATLLGDLSVAEEALYKGAALVERLQEPLRKATLSAALASQLQELLQKNDPKLSNPLLEANARNLWKAVQQFSEISSNTRLKSNAYGNIGHLNEMQGNYEQAFTATRSALFFAQHGPYPEMIYRWHWQLGRLFDVTGQKDKALKAYQTAIENLKPIQTKLMQSYRNTPGYFQKNIKPIYYGLASLYLEMAEKSNDTDNQQLQLKKARLNIEQMKAAEVEDFFNDECAIAFRKKAKSLDNIGKKSAVIYPMPFKDELVVVVTLPSGIMQITSPVDQATLTRTVKQFRKYLQDSSHQSFVGPGEKLYHWIIDPLEEKLQKEDIDTLVVIPDEALSLIPFAALYDGENFLIEKYAIVTTPSLQLTDPQPAPRKNFEALLVGLSKSVQGFPPLPNVPEELNTIGEILQSKPEQLLDQTYEKKALANAVTRNAYRIIHMATHGEFSSDPNQTFLLTYDGKLSLNQFGSLLKLGQFSDKPVELLTLSACNTAVGDIQASFGLAGIALESGARSAVATLWSVHDEATMIAMTDFYRKFRTRPDLNKAQALQAAQLNLIDQSQYNHPAYWSPFLFIGNWL